MFGSDGIFTRSIVNPQRRSCSAALTPEYSFTLDHRQSWGRITSPAFTGFLDGFHHHGDGERIEWTADGVPRRGGVGKKYPSGQIEWMKDARAPERQRQKVEIRVSQFDAPLQQPRRNEKEPIGKKRPDKPRTSKTEVALVS